MQNNIHVFQNHLQQLRAFHFYFSTMSNLKKNLLVLGEFHYALHSVYNAEKLPEHEVLYTSSVYVNHCRKLIAKIDKLLKAQSQDFLIHDVRNQGQNYARQLENFKADVQNFNGYDASLMPDGARDFVERQSIVPLAFNRDGDENHNQVFTAFEMLDKFHHECCALSYLGILDGIDFRQDLPVAQEAPEPMDENPLHKKLRARDIVLEHEGAQESLLTMMYHVHNSQTSIKRLAAHQSFKYIELIAALKPVSDYYIQHEQEQRRASNVRASNN